ncbi:putative membrane protein [Desulfosporosinus acidiphilus SJ4]|uniref:Putative membrane protein n=1 Tax=Desulfosporosinus acidiphilus (strain DSM 22704 / JCM 16185 / SJ4) TaxID=646529 RepID=I4D917_DESAJ|nr:trimeric intracellular cation channel family protein [Desulfosporosinus acidiphilus]AFM42291.1 putative membrane protein [Desulfosporosinus acidiphilus SJ4]
MLLEDLSIIGTIAFALSGALVAIEEEYDIFGILVLGFITAFGGGMIRNLTIGLPVALFWNQNLEFMYALIAIILVIILPTIWIRFGQKPILLCDALGLSVFSAQGAIYAQKAGYSVAAIMVAAALTGIGGGMLRDVLAQRKPIVLRDDVYAIWALFSGAMIGLKWINLNVDWQVYGLILVVFLLRVLSIFFKWKLPRVIIHKSSVLK